MKSNLIYIVVVAFLLSACGENNGNKNAGPIVLGDSSTIVTETDAKYLKDEVMDLEPGRKQDVEAAPASVTTEIKKEQTPVAGVQNPQQNAASGYTISFDKIKIVFEGINANDAITQNPENQEALSYLVKSGNLAASKIHIYGAKNASVKMRYQTKLQLSTSLGTVDLRNMGLYTSDWKENAALKASGEPTFALTDLSNLNYSTISSSKLKSATEKELHNRHTNRRTIQSWMNEISNTKSVTDKPCEIKIDNLQLQISGTGNDGKTFRKRIRMTV